jgi:hypothetical protein
MSNFNYIEYLKNNPLLKGEKTQSTKLITEAQESTINSLQKLADDTSKMPADRDKARNKMYDMKAKMKKSELKAKIREEIILSLKEEKSGIHKLSSLTWDKITSILPVKNSLFFPAGGDVRNRIDDERDFEDWKQSTMEKFGDVGIKLNPGAVWSRQVEIIDDIFAQSSRDSMASKQSFLDRNQGSLDENTLEEEDYEKMSREVEYGIRPDYDEEEIDMEDLFADLDGDFEGMPMDFEPINEKEEEEEESEEDIDIEVEEPAADDTPSSPQGLTAEEQEIQNSLKIAYDNAVSMGDQKLADQIGNSITFFTRTHVVER